MKQRPSVLILASIFLTGQGPCGAVDQDGDGYTTEAGDCDDTDASTYPGALERCDGVDNDCDPATAEECVPSTFQYSYRLSSISASGEDNGRVEPAYYSEQLASLDLDPFDGQVSGDLEYVHSAAAQVASLSPTLVEAIGKASAGGADDYRYGKGSSTGESTFKLTFGLERHTFLAVSGLLTTFTCNDPATVDAFLYLSDADTDYLHFSGTEELNTQVELEPGVYTLLLEAYVNNTMSGGGDAYPCGEAGFQLLMQIMG